MKTHGKSPNQALTTFVISMIFGGVVGFFAVGHVLGPPSDQSPAEFAGHAVKVLISFFAIVALQVFIHEFGHFAAGKLARFELAEFYVKPIRMSKKMGRWALSYELKHPLLGYVAMVPKGDDRLVARFRWVVAGGILANLAVGILALPFVLLQPASDVNPLTSGWLWLLTSLLFVVANGAPYVSRGNSTDGKILWNLRRDDPNARRTIALLIISRELLANKRPRDLSPSAIKNLAEPQDGSPSEMISLFYSCHYFADNDRWDEFWKATERTKALLDRPGGKEGVAAQVAGHLYAFTVAWRANRPEEAQQFLEELPDRLSALKTSRKLACAAIACRLGQRERAKALCDEVEKLWRNERGASGLGDATALELIQEIRAECEKIETKQQVERSKDMSTLNPE